MKQIIKVYCSCIVIINHLKNISHVAMGYVVMNIRLIQDLWGLAEFIAQFKADISFTQFSRIAVIVIQSIK